MNLAHHPSCRETDISLVYHCDQCGLNEPAPDAEELRQALREADEQVFKLLVALKSGAEAAALAKQEIKAAAFQWRALLRRT